MKKVFIFSLFIGILGTNYGQDFTRQADSLKNKELLMPALQE
ncbi:hypothetical protein [Winogradskyella schleiferi]|nr:hypothetical protein [Winogradskyella schleiferi]